jgi:hypothetical protein
MNAHRERCMRGVPARARGGRGAGGARARAERAKQRARRGGSCPRTGRRWRARRGGASAPRVGTRRRASAGTCGWAPAPLRPLPTPRSAAPTTAGPCTTHLLFIYWAIVHYCRSRQMYHCWIIAGMRTEAKPRYAF